MKYRAKPGAPLNDEKATVYGEFLQKLAKQNNYEFTAQFVVRNAESKASPIHDWFEWDDFTAANLYRERQAGDLIRSIEMEVEYPNEKRFIRAFVNVIVKTNSDSDRVYVPVIKAFSEDGSRTYIVQKALEELRSWQARYQDYQELAEIYSAIDVAIHN